MLIGKYKTYSYSIITQTIFPRNSTQGIVRSHVIARVSAPVKMASVNIQISKNGHQLPEQLIYTVDFFILMPDPEPLLTGLARRRDPGSRSPVPDPETLPSMNVG